jgi:hypothetical protein
MAPDASALRPQNSFRNRGQVGVGALPRVLLALLALALAAPAVAVQYHVEVVLFAYLEPDPREGPTVAIGGPEPANGSFPSASRRLGGIADRLRSSAGFRLLAHEAWRQPDLLPARARSVGLAANDPDIGRISGTVLLRRQRVMVAEVDLWLEDPVTFERYRLHDTRRIRSGDLHYFDHPRIGVIMEINAGE